MYNVHRKPALVGENINFVNTRLESNEQSLDIFFAFAEFLSNMEWSVFKTYLRRENLPGHNVGLRVKVSKKNPPVSAMYVLYCLFIMRRPDQPVGTKQRISCRKKESNKPPRLIFGTGLKKEA